MKTTRRQFLTTTGSARAHAQGNGLFVICCNCAPPNSSGTTCIYPPGGEPLVILSPNEEQLGIATINLAMDAGWKNIGNGRVVKNGDPQPKP